LEAVLEHTDRVFDWTSHCRKAAIEFMLFNIGEREVPFLLEAGMTLTVRANAESASTYSPGEKKSLGGVVSWDLVITLVSSVLPGQSVDM
jgi:hypothetical protein